MVSRKDLQDENSTYVVKGSKTGEDPLSEFKFHGLWGTLKVLWTKICLKPPHHNKKAEELQPSTL